MRWLDGLFGVLRIVPPLHHRPSIAANYPDQTGCTVAAMAGGALAAAALLLTLALGLKPRAASPPSAAAQEHADRHTT